MLNRSTLARPYARAAFEAARDEDRLDRWSQALEFAAGMLDTEVMRYLVGDPRVGRDRVLDVFAEVGGDRFDDSFLNFLRITTVNGRLELLPEIAAQFEHYRRDAEQRIKVHVASAMAMDDDETARLAERLKARFGREVEMDVEVDESLIGGAVIRAGDQVIDGSVRGRLEQLGRQMTG